MSWNISGITVQEGDLVQLVGVSFKSYIFKLEGGKELHTHRGVVKHSDLIGLAWGTQVFSHMGSSFFLLQPSLPDLIKNTPRATNRQLCLGRPATNQAMLRIHTVLAALCS